MATVPVARLLPAASPISRLSYVGSQILADLGPSETELTARAVKRIHKSLPVPVEQEVLWADVAFGTRPHGLVLTNAGIFLKDGPADDEDDDEDLGETPADTGYHYLRWHNFDPALISHREGHPTLDGQPFRDADRFFGLAAACVRLTNRRVRMRRAGRKAASPAIDTDGPVRTRWRPTVKETFQSCLDDEGFWGPVTTDDLPLRVEVPADQYDALLQRVHRKVADGWAPPLEDPDAAAVLVRKSPFTYLQGVNLAKTGRIPNVAYNPATGAVACATFAVRRGARRLARWPPQAGKGRPNLRGLLRRGRRGPGQRGRLGSRRLAGGPGQRGGLLGRQRRLHRGAHRGGRRRPRAHGRHGHHVRALSLGGELCAGRRVRPCRLPGGLDGQRPVLRARGTGVRAPARRHRGQRRVRVRPDRGRADRPRKPHGQGGPPGV